MMGQQAVTSSVIRVMAMMATAVLALLVLRPVAVVTDAFIMVRGPTSTTTPASLTSRLLLSSSGTTSLRMEPVEDTMVELGSSSDDVTNTTTDSKEETTNVDNDEKNRRMKHISFLQSLGAITGRGEFATKQQKDSAAQVVRALEACNPTPYPTTDASSSSLSGTWELVYTNTQLFRSSPFFMAGRAVCTTDTAAQQYNYFCDLHRASLSISQIESVKQIIDTTNGKLTSEFAVRAGAIPFLSDFTPLSYSGGVPVSITGALVSTADITPTLNGTAWEVYMDTVQVKGSNIPGLRQLLDTMNVQLQSRSLANVLEQTIASYTTPKPIFRITYLEDQYRICRDQDDHVFFYVKTSPSTDVTDYRNIDSDLGIGRLLEGFNDAITKFYI